MLYYLGLILYVYLALATARCALAWRPARTLTPQTIAMITKIISAIAMTIELAVFPIFQLRKRQFLSLLARRRSRRSQLGLTISLDILGLEERISASLVVILLCLNQMKRLVGVSVHLKLGCG